MEKCQYKLTRLESRFGLEGSVVSRGQRTYSPSPVASQCAASGPSSATARASYSATTSGVRVSVQRPFVPLFIKTWAPASQKAPPRGTLFLALRFIQSKEQYSRVSSQR